jgi:hypothetical protein
VEPACDIDSVSDKDLKKEKEETHRYGEEIDRRIESDDSYLGPLVLVWNAI